MFAKTVSAHDTVEDPKIGENVYDVCQKTYECLQKEWLKSKCSKADERN